MQVEALIALGQTITDPECSLERRLDALHDYVKTMDLALKDEASLKALSPEVGTKLQRTHEQVLAVAKQLLGDTGDGLRTLNTRGKAILAYMDVLPKSVSVFSNKKG